MILREATADDLRPLLTLCKKAWTHLGLSFDAGIDHRRVLNTHSARVVVARDGSRILAALAARPIDTADGPGYQIYLYVTDHDEPDPTLALAAVSLYACHLANGEGRHVILSHRVPSASYSYGRDVLGMRGLADGAEDTQVGDARDIAAAILRVYPQWQPSF